MTDGLKRELSCDVLLGLAERELGGFFTAVTELYGSEQARISAEDWIEEFELLDGPPQVSARELRLVTIAAAARLAKRSPTSKPILMNTR